MGQERILETRSLVKTFRERKTGREIRVLDGIDLGIREGEFTCIVGPSGCGKTTLLRILCGLEPPTSGDVLFEGRHVLSPGPDRAMVFQEFALFPWKTVLKNVMFGLAVKGFERKEARITARELLKMVGLEGCDDLFPRELSGGMKQKVALARTLAVEPKIMLMDEPFGSLDAQTRASMQELLVEIWLRTRKTIVFVTHSVDEAVFLGQRIICLTARPSRIGMELSNDLSYLRERTDPGLINMTAGILEYVKLEASRQTGNVDLP